MNSQVNVYDAELPWTQLMDSALHAVHTELKANKEDLLKDIRSTPFHADMREVRSCPGLGRRVQ